MTRRSAPRLAIIAPAGLGDSLQATPMLPALRATYPRARIDVITLRPTSTELFAGLSHLVDRVVHLPYWTGGTFAFVRAFARFAAFERYDASFLIYPAARFEYHLLHALVRSRHRFSHDYGPVAFDRLPGFRTRRIATTPGGNVARNAALFRAFDTRIAPNDRYAIPPAWKAVGDVGSRPIVIHVGSINHDTFAAKRWPLDHFVELACRLVARGEHVAFLSGPDEREETRQAHVRTSGSALIERDLLGTTHVLDTAELVITNDSGIGHLSAGLGRAVVSLFGPTPIEYAPYGGTATALRPTTCPPCFDVLHSDMSCKLDIDYACLRRDLSVDLVEKTVLAILANARTATRPGRSA